MRIVTVAENNFAQTILNLFVTTHDDFILAGEASSYAAAVELSGENLPDIVLMDLNVLVTNGIDTIRQLKLQHPQLHIILLTDERDPEQLHAALVAGADVHLSQFTSCDKLAHIIQAVGQLDYFSNRLQTT